MNRRRFQMREIWKPVRVVPPVCVRCSPSPLPLLLSFPPLRWARTPPAWQRKTGSSRLCWPSSTSSVSSTELKQLRPSPTQTAAADHHSLEMVRSGYFGHESADGSHFAKRIKAFYQPRRARRPWAVGENLIWQAPRLTARAAVVSWLASPGHRDNLLESAFREVGISAVRARGAPWRLREPVGRSPHCGLRRSLGGSGGTVLVAGARWRL